MHNFLIVILSFYISCSKKSSIFYVEANIKKWLILNKILKCPLWLQNNKIYYIMIGIQRIHFLDYCILIHPPPCAPNAYIFKKEN